jgi:hypothetical protein
MTEDSSFSDNLMVPHGAALTRIGLPNVYDVSAPAVDLESGSFAAATGFLFPRLRGVSGADGRALHANIDGLKTRAMALSSDVRSAWVSDDQVVCPCRVRRQPRICARVQPRRPGSRRVSGQLEPTQRSSLSSSASSCSALTWNTSAFRFAPTTRRGRGRVAFRQAPKCASWRTRMMRGICSGRSCVVGGAPSRKRARRPRR